MEKSEFYTLKGYQKKNSSETTEAMEDYLEMIYRKSIIEKEVHIVQIAKDLNVKKSSASKMINKLKSLNYVEGEKYGCIFLTKKGNKLGKYLMWRHNVITRFFMYLNNENYSLEQVEKVEHYIDYFTILALEDLLNNINKQ